MTDQEPNLVISSLSGIVTKDGITVEVNIVRMDNEADWSLEVVNSEGTSTVWEDPFASDHAALAAFNRAVHKEGMTTFLDSAQIIPFPKR